ncbi:MAG: hypothetical protein J6Y17_01325 [Elusimicrobiaceae bacterium]|nr:hypothetical protein [Elusimicrobiaceae bacterium]
MNKQKALIILSTLLAVLTVGCAHIPQQAQVDEAKTNLRAIGDKLGTYYAKNKKYPAQDSQADRFAALNMQDPSNDVWKYRFFCNNHANTCFATARNLEKDGKQMTLRLSVEKSTPQSFIYVQQQQTKAAKQQGDLKLSTEQRSQASKSACEKIGGRFDEKMSCVLE